MLNLGEQHAHMVQFIIWQIAMVLIEHNMDDINYKAFKSIIHMGTYNIMIFIKDY